MANPFRNQSQPKRFTSVEQMHKDAIAHGATGTFDIMNSIVAVTSGGEVVAHSKGGITQPWKPDIARQMVIRLRDMVNRADIKAMPHSQIIIEKILEKAKDIEDAAVLADRILNGETISDEESRALGFEPDNSIITGTRTVVVPTGAIHQGKMVN